MTGRTHSVLSALKPWGIVIGTLLVVGLADKFAEFVAGLL